MRRVPLLLALLLLLASAGAVRAADTASFTLKDLDGKTVKLSDLSAKGPVLLSFWGTFCEPCKKEIPHLVEIAKEFQAEKLQLALIAVDGPRSQKQIKPFVASKGWQMPVLLDPNGQTMKKLKGGNPPYTMLVGTDGKVLYTHSGYKPGDEKTLRAELRKLLAGAKG